MRQLMPPVPATTWAEFVADIEGRNVHAPFAVIDAVLPTIIINYEPFVTRIGSNGTDIQCVLVSWREGGTAFEGVASGDVFDADHLDRRVVLNVEGALRDDGRLPENRSFEFIMGRGISALTRERLQAVCWYAEENQPVTVRGCCYHLFTRGLIESMGKKFTDEISRILVRAREEGDLRWDWIVDETRELEGGGGWDSLEEYGESVLRSYRKNRWLDQDTRVELWSEKGTVRGLLAPVLDRYQIPFRVMHGYGSATSVKDISVMIEDTTYYGKDFVALYCGDWDPSGLDMSERDLPNRLDKYTDYGAEFTIKRIALVKEDLVGLPSFPLETKKGDPRYAWYQKNYHHSLAWELDAMNPIAVRDRVEEEILRYINNEAWIRAAMVEQAERASIKQFANTLKTLR